MIPFWSTSTNDRALEAVNWVARTKPPSARARNISATGVEARKKPGATVSTATSTPVQTRMLRKPKRRIIRAASGREISAPTAMPMVRNPACSGDQPMAIWTRSGIRNGVAPMPMRTRVPPVQLARKVFSFRSDRSSTGFSARRAWWRKPMIDAMATASAASCTVQGIRWKPRVSARPMVVDMATAARTKPRVSKGPGCGWRVLGTKRATAIIPRTPTGRLI